MIPFHLHPDFFNRPIRIEQGKTALQVIRDFFVDFPLLDVRIMLGIWQDELIKSEGDYYAAHEHRSELLYHCDRIEELIEAAYIINESNKQAPQKA